MIEQCLALQEVLPFFGNKSYRFQEAVCTVFGTDIRDSSDVINLTQDFRAVMWDKVNNGRVLVKKEIYTVRGSSVLITEIKNSKHHWPPSSKGGELTIKVPDQFHRAWHDVFMNLHTKEEFDIFWQIIFSVEDIVLRDVVDFTLDCVSTKAKAKKKKKKR